MRDDRKEKREGVQNSENLMRTSTVNLLMRKKDAPQPLRVKSEE
jgi:hypothetical protein